MTYDKLLQWRPTLSAVVGTLPELLGSPSAQMNISMQFENMDALKIYTTAFDLEVLRKCDGVSSVAEIIDSIEAQGNMDVLRASLFRAYHYGILS